MLVFCIIYCRDNIYHISLFDKFLPSNSKPNKSNFYAYNLFEVIWCWFEWEQAISMCFHTFDRDKYIDVWCMEMSCSEMVDMHAGYFRLWGCKNVEDVWMVLKTFEVQRCRNMWKCGSTCVEQVHAHHWTLVHNVLVINTRSVYVFFRIFLTYSLLA